MWGVLTTPGTEAYHHIGAPLIIFKLVGNAFFLIFDIVLIFLFFAKSYRFPDLMIAFIASYLLFVVGADVIPEGGAESVKVLCRTIIGAVIWIPYFLVSKRVKNTFVKPVVKSVNAVVI
jgi:hypothetical protein